ncbi:calcitonin gene-related peptide type 1 receptor-like [Elysia marginata]|uniref:Calcitonin gene-related peptide type 1 receptor-like n=1 Tax=Elysia marginata TaxID=1093978 RepID=A0AAV4EQW7_9GAST|nr:calcitonin gene-related peptide type 1 receptor-like [Elysia marginata]
MDVCKHLVMCFVIYTDSVLDILPALWPSGKDTRSDIGRQLRRQHRIQIHVNLLLSLVLTNIVWILWESLVYKDRMENTTENTIMHQDTVGCKILYALTRYTLSANYFWMFLEGAHLFRLIENAFVVPRSIFSYFFFGWLIITRIGLYFRCWVRMFAGYEWWVYTPNLVILLCNFLFLVWIVICLTRQIQVHPNEPGSFRRALKALAVLTPLFGLQMLVFIYRPSDTASSVYEIGAVICKSSQGSVVALIFCYLNKEVRTQIHLRLRSFKQGSWWTDRWPRTLHTRTSRRQSQMANINRKSDQSFIDLSVRPGGQGHQRSSCQGGVQHGKRSNCVYNAISQDSSINPSISSTPAV